MNRINWRLLIKVAKGKASEAEIEQFEAWLKESPAENLAIFEEVKEVYENDEQNTDTSAQTKIAFTSFLRHNQLEEEYHADNDGHQTLQAIKPTPAKWLSRAAAAVALVIITVGAGLLWKRDSISGHMAEQSSEQLQWRELHVEYGRQINITLADGSVIRLQPGSSLRYPETFAANERRVQLEGEAFFEVSKNPSKPFVVQTANLETRVLGTSFNIEAFKGQVLNKVTVVTGRVSVSKKGRGKDTKLLAYLTPNKQIIFSPGTDSFELKHLTENVSKAIRDGKLVFDNSSMLEIALAIERRYGIHVRFTDTSIATMHLTTTIDYMSLDSMSSILSMVSGLEITHEANNLFFALKQ